ncbi:MAG: ribosome silencing factor [Deltaproteobacteria bacterium]|nr:ribosome silencing factor [Deltaproteobacteria bacterium]
MVKKVTKSKTTALSSELLQKAQLIAEVAIQKKALDVLMLNVAKISDIGDVFVIASGTSDRHVKGIADRIVDTIRENLGVKPLTISGMEKGEWVLIDYADVIVHVFHEPVRQFYDLEGLWAKAEPIELNKELDADAKKLRTGMLIRRKKLVLKNK